MFIRFAALAAAITMFALPAFADESPGPQCGAPADMLKVARDRYQEVPAFSGTLQSGLPFTITLSPSGTWTIFAGVEGQLCAVGSGEHWAAAEAPAVKPTPENLPVAPALLPNGLRAI